MLSNTTDEHSNRSTTRASIRVLLEQVNCEMGRLRSGLPRRCNKMTSSEPACLGHSHQCPYRDGWWEAQVLEHMYLASVLDSTPHISRSGVLDSIQDVCCLLLALSRKVVQDEGKELLCD